MRKTGTALVLLLLLKSITLSQYTGSYHVGVAQRRADGASPVECSSELRAGLPCFRPSPKTATRPADPIDCWPEITSRNVSIPWGCGFSGEHTIAIPSEERGTPLSNSRQRIHINFRTIVHHNRLPPNIIEPDTQLPHPQNRAVPEHMILLRNRDQA